MDVLVSNRIVYLDLALTGAGVVLCILALCHWLWVAYVAWAALKQRQSEGTLSTLDKLCGYPVIATGFLIDVFLNLTLATVVLLELPRWKEWTVSERSMRHALDALRRWAADKVRTDMSLAPLPPASRLYRWRWKFSLRLLREIGSHDKSGYHTPKL